MAVIYVSQVVKDFVEFGIAEKYHFDGEKIVKGLTDILANYGLKIKFTVPQSSDLKAIKKHYSAIVKQILSNTRRNRPVDSDFKNPSETVFYSVKKYPHLCIVDHERRYA